MYAFIFLNLSKEKKTSKVKMDCNICCEAINGTNPVVKCDFCEFDSCNRCTERYLLESHDDAHCMNCKKGWTADILHKKMTKVFVSKKYKKHREDVLLDREKSMIPQTQPDVEAELQRRERNKLIRELKSRERELLKQIRETRQSIYDVENGDEIRSDESKRFQYTRKCPVENCKGFLDTKWTCGICETLVCSKCNEPKGENHECNPDDVETMKLLKRDSKPCPACGMLITKIDGCDQMWCTAENCHTAFSWKTGQKVYGNIHNPHFIQFTLQGGRLERDVGDIPCGGIPDYWIIVNRMDELRKIHPGEETLLMKKQLTWFNRLLRHLEAIELHAPPAVNNTDIRVQFMLNELPECKFKFELQKREKRAKKKKEFLDVTTMFVHTGSDILRHIVDLLPLTRHVRVDMDAIREQIEIINKLRKYANSQYERIGKIFACVPPYISRDLEYFRHKPKTDR